MSSLTNAILVIVSMFILLEACGGEEQEVTNIPDAGADGGMDDFQVTLCQVSQDKVGQPPCPSGDDK